MLRQVQEGLAAFAIKNIALARKSWQNVLLHQIYFVILHCQNIKHRGSHKKQVLYT